jgi:hypothetical protein
MKTHPRPQTAIAVTLQSALDRLALDDSLSEARKRDLRSAIVSFAKLAEQPPAAIPLDVPCIRRTLDGMVPALAQISAKRWANLRSDLTAAIWRPVNDRGRYLQPLAVGAPRVRRQAEEIERLRAVAIRAAESAVRGDSKKRTP